MARLSTALGGALLLLAAGLPTAQAWGAMGHETVAYIASNFVAAGTKSYFQALLNDSSADYLAAVSAWADSYRSTAAGKFSAPFHYIDAEDDPPHSCGIDLARDCGPEGCVVSALANYTSRLVGKTTSKGSGRVRGSAAAGNLSTAERQIAAKMVIHFVGDIGQPLHCEALDKGGNGIPVTYHAHGSNLHSIWDSAIPESIANGSSMAAAKSWATTLTKGMALSTP